MKCKILALVEKLRPRLTWHLQYLQKRYAKIEDKLDSIRKKKSTVTLARLKSSGSCTNFKPTKHERFKFEKPGPPAKPDEINDECGRYFIKVDIIEELCALLTTEEIDQIAEDPKFYFPPTEDDRYADLWDIEKWNYIADRLTKRIEPDSKLDKQVSLPNLKRKLPVPPPALTVPKPPKCANRRTESYGSKDFDIDKFIYRRNNKIADDIESDLNTHIAVVNENKLLRREEWQKRMHANIEHIEKKMTYGAKNALEKHKQLIKAREDKQNRAIKLRIEREERLDRIRYNEQMLVLNEQVKELCKNQPTDRRKVNVPPETFIS